MRRRENVLRREAGFCRFRGNQYRDHLSVRNSLLGKKGGVFSKRVENISDYIPINDEMSNHIRRLIIPVLEEYLSENGDGKTEEQILTIARDIADKTVVEIREKMVPAKANG